MVEATPLIGQRQLMRNYILGLKIVHSIYT